MFEQMNVWRQIHQSRWEQTQPGRCSQEDVDLTVYRLANGRWFWRVDFTGDGQETLARGNAPSESAAKSAALRAARYES